MQIAQEIRWLIDDFDSPVPAILEIPTKVCPCLLAGAMQMHCMHLGGAWGPFFKYRHPIWIASFLVALVLQLCLASLRRIRYVGILDFLTVTCLLVRRVNRTTQRTTQCISRSNG